MLNRGDIFYENGQCRHLCIGIVKNRYVTIFKTCAGSMVSLHWGQLSASHKQDMYNQDGVKYDAR